MASPLEEVCRTIHLGALMESADLVLHVRAAMRAVDRLGYAMQSAVKHDPASIPDVVARMTKASETLLAAASAFHAAMERALAGPPS